MTKAALFTLGLAALLGFPAALTAQNSTASAVNEAVNEAVLRQAKTILLRQKLSDARATAQRGDLVLAAKTYQEACTLAQQIGSGIDPETAQAVDGLTTARLALARDAQSRGDLREAQLQVQQIVNTEKDLKVAPHLNEVLAFKQQNDQMIDHMKGRTPSAPVLDQVADITAQKVKAATLVQDGKLFYEMGMMPEAEAKLHEALKMDPDNTGASFYLDIIQQAKIGRDTYKHNSDTQVRMEQVEKQWVLPRNEITDPNRPNPYATNSLVYTGPGRQAIVAKLDKMRLDNFTTGDGMPLSEVLRSLSQQIKLRDPEHKGINFLINPNADQSGKPEAAPANVGFGLGVPGGANTTGLGGAGGAGFGGRAGPAGVGPGGVGAIDPATGLPVASATPAAGGGEEVDAGAFMVKIPSLIDVRLADVLDAIITVAQNPVNGDLRRLKFSITDFAIVFQVVGPDSPLLVMRTFKVDPNTFYSGLESVSSESFGGSSGNNGSNGGNGGGNNGGNSGGNNGGNNSGGGSGGGGVVGVVNAFAGAGGLRSGNNQGGGGAGGGGGGGGFGGGGGGGASTAINPLSATGTGGGGAGGAQGAGAGGGAGAGNVGGQGGLQYITQVTIASTPSAAARAFFSALGVNLLTPPGKAIFFNDKSGVLLVRATEQDLDIIERAIQTLNQVSPQVHIKARFIEVQQSDNNSLGFDWYLGQFNLGKNVVGTGGSSPSLNVPTSPANPLGAFPGNTVASLVPGAAGNQQLFSSGSSAPTVATFTGILTQPNFQVALHMLQTRSGSENLAEPEATTISGRQTQMRGTTLINVVTGFSFNNGTSSGGTAGNNGGGGVNTINQAGTSAVQPQTTSIETGPILDVVPYVLSDGYTINMALIPSLTEFNGYDSLTTASGASQIPGYNPGSALAGAANGTTLPVALPKFTIRQAVATVNVWDNQTVVLGGLIASTSQSSKNQLPVIGDIPVVGKLFRSQSKSTTKQNLMIFVTATIVDPAGNRVHSDNDLPFAQTGFPVQPPGAGQIKESVQEVHSLPPANP